MPVYAEYVVWCPECEWNLIPTADPEKPSLREIYYRKLGQRFTDDLFRRVLAAPSLRPSWTVSKVLAFCIAGLVHALSLGVLAIGLLILIRSWPNLVLSLYGVMLLGFAWVLRPGVLRLAKGATIVDRAQVPALYDLLDEIARRLDTPPIHGVLVDASFNAAYAKVGWRRKRIVIIGMPLFATLEPDEQLAILGHELGHDVNGDAARAFFIATACEALLNWYQLLAPSHIWPWSQDPLLGLVFLPFNIVLWLVSRIPYLGVYLLVHLLWHDSQRAEYMADDVAARMAGPEAMARALEKLYCGKVYPLALQRFRARQGQLDLFAELRREAAHLLDGELERQRRIDERWAARLDVTHPPTPRRIALLAARPAQPLLISLTAERRRELARDLQLLEEQVYERLLSEYGYRRQNRVEVSSAT